MFWGWIGKKVLNENFKDEAHAAIHRMKVLVTVLISIIFSIKFSPNLAVGQTSSSSSSINPELIRLICDVTCDTSTCDTCTTTDGQKTCPSEEEKETCSQTKTKVCEEEERKCYKAQVEKFQHTPSNSTTDSCREAQRALTKAEDDMNKDCSGSCLTKAAMCSRCSLGEEECEELDEKDHEDDISTVLMQIGARPGINMENVRRLRRSLRTCPLVAKEDLDTLKDEIEDLKKKKNDLEKDIQDKKQEIIELKSDDSKAQQEFDEKINKLKREAQKIQNELETSLEKATDDVRKQVLSVKEQLRRSDGEIHALRLELINANDAFHKARLEAEGKCHESALKQVGEQRLRKAQLVQQGKDIKAGGFNALLRQAGLSTRKSAAALVQRLRRNCMNDKIFRDKMTLLLQSTNKIKKQIESAIQGKEQEKVNLHNQVTELLNKAPREAQAALKRASQELKYKEQAVEAAQKQRLTERQELQAKIQNVHHSIQTLQREQQENLDYLNNKQHILGLKQKHQVPGLKNDISTAIGSVETAKTKARDVMSQCDCPTSSGVLGEGLKQKEVWQKCQSAYRLLNRILPDEDYPDKATDFRETPTSPSRSESTH